MPGIDWRKATIPLAMVLVLVLVFFWTYWTTMEMMADTWTRDAAYSHGFIIPFLALGLLCHRLWTTPANESWVSEPVPWALGLLVVAMLLRLFHAFFFINWFDYVSFLLIGPALSLMFGGWAFFRRAWPALAFLIFMIPLPSKIAGSNVVATLQSVSTLGSTFCLQTLGLFAFQEGNIILMKDTELGVVEACSGLRMLMVFCAMATATAIILPLGWQRRVIIILSAVPLAMACNVARITAAGLASDRLGSEMGHFVFHDLAGYIMMPLAFALLGGEVFLLGKLFEEVPEEKDASLGSRRLAAGG